MSTVPLATASAPCLADVVDGHLAAALAGRDDPCLWCGATPVRVEEADLWSGHVVIVCPACGSELTGAVPRRLREVVR